MEGPLRTSKRNRVVDPITATDKIGIAGGSTLNRNIPVRSVLFEARRQETIVFPVPNSLQQAGSWFAAPVYHNRFVNLDLIWRSDLLVMGFVMIGICVIVVALDRALSIDSSRLEYHAIVCVTHKNVQPSAPRGISRRKLVSTEITHRDCNRKASGSQG